MCIFKNLEKIQKPGESFSKSVVTLWMSVQMLESFRIFLSKLLKYDFLFKQWLGFYRESVSIGQDFFTMFWVHFLKVKLFYWVATHLGYWDHSE